MTVWQRSVCGSQSDGNLNAFDAYHKIIMMRVMMTMIIAIVIIILIVNVKFKLSI